MAKEDRCREIGEKGDKNYTWRYYRGKVSEKEKVKNQQVREALHC